MRLSKNIGTDFSIQTTPRHKDLYPTAKNRNKQKKLFMRLLRELAQYEGVPLYIEYLNLCAQAYKLGSIEQRVEGIHNAVSRLSKYKFQEMAIFKREYLLHILWKLQEQFREDAYKKHDAHFFDILVEMTCLVGDLAKEEGQYGLLKALLRDYPSAEYSNIYIRNDIYTQRLDRYKRLFIDYLPRIYPEFEEALSSNNIALEKIFEMFNFFIYWLLLAQYVEGKVSAGFQGNLHSAKIILGTEAEGKFAFMNSLIKDLLGTKDINLFMGKSIKTYSKFLFSIFQTPVHLFPNTTKQFYYIADAKIFFESGLQNLKEKLLAIATLGDQRKTEKYLSAYGMATEEYAQDLLENTFHFKRSSKDHHRQDYVIKSERDKTILCIECTVSGVDEPDYYSVEDSQIIEALNRLFFDLKKDKSGSAKLEKLDYYCRQLKKENQDYRIIPVLLTEDFNGTWELFIKSHLGDTNPTVSAKGLTYLTEVEPPKLITLDDIEFYIKHFDSGDKDTNTTALIRILDEWSQKSLREFPNPLIFFLNSIYSRATK